MNGHANINPLNTDKQFIEAITKLQESSKKELATIINHAFPNADIKSSIPAQTVFAAGSNGKVPKEFANYNKILKYIGDEELKDTPHNHAAAVELFNKLKIIDSYLPSLKSDQARAEEQKAKALEDKLIEEKANEAVKNLDDNEVVDQLQAFTQQRIADINKARKNLLNYIIEHLEDITKYKQVAANVINELSDEDAITQYNNKADKKLETNPSNAMIARTRLVSILMIEAHKNKAHLEEPSDEKSEEIPIKKFNELITAIINDTHKELLGNNDRAKLLVKDRLDELLQTISSPISPSISSGDPEPDPHILELAEKIKKFLNQGTNKTVYQSIDKNKFLTDILCAEDVSAAMEATQNLTDRNFLRGIIQTIAEDARFKKILELETEKTTSIPDKSTTSESKTEPHDDVLTKSNAMMAQVKSQMAQMQRTLDKKSDERLAASPPPVTPAKQHPLAVSTDSTDLNASLNVSRETDDKNKSVLVITINQSLRKYKRNHPADQSSIFQLFSRLDELVTKLEDDLQWSDEDFWSAYRNFYLFNTLLHRLEKSITITNAPFVEYAEFLVTEILSDAEFSREKLTTFVKFSETITTFESEEISEAEKARFASNIFNTFRGIQSPTELGQLLELINEFEIADSVAKLALIQKNIREATANENTVRSAIDYIISQIPNTKQTPASIPNILTDIKSNHTPLSIRSAPVTHAVETPVQNTAEKEIQTEFPDETKKVVAKETNAQAVQTDPVSVVIPEAKQDKTLSRESEAQTVVLTKGAETQIDEIEAAPGAPTTVIVQAPPEFKLGSGAIHALLGELKLTEPTHSQFIESVEHVLAKSQSQQDFKSYATLYADLRQLTTLKIFYDRNKGTETDSVKRAQELYVELTTNPYVPEKATQWVPVLANENKVAFVEGLNNLVIELQDYWNKKYNPQLSADHKDQKGADVKAQPVPHPTLLLDVRRKISLGLTAKQISEIHLDLEHLIYLKDYCKDMSAVPMAKDTPQHQQAEKLLVALMTKAYIPGEPASEGSKLQHERTNRIAAIKRKVLAWIDSDYLVELRAHDITDNPEQTLDAKLTTTQPENALVRAHAQKALRASEKLKNYLGKPYTGTMKEEAKLFEVISEYQDAEKGIDFVIPELPGVSDRRHYRTGAKSKMMDFLNYAVNIHTDSKSDTIQEMDEFKQFKGKPALLQAMGIFRGTVFAHPVYTEYQLEKLKKSFVAFFGRLDPRMGIIAVGNNRVQLTPAEELLKNLYESTKSLAKYRRQLDNKEYPILYQPSSNPLKLPDEGELIDKIKKLRKEPFTTKSDADRLKELKNYQKALDKDLKESGFSLYLDDNGQLKENEVEKLRQRTIDAAHKYIKFIHDHKENEVKQLQRAIDHLGTRDSKENATEIKTLRENIVDVTQKYLNTVGIINYFFGSILAIHTTIKYDSNGAMKHQNSAFITDVIRKFKSAVLKDLKLDDPTSLAKYKKENYLTSVSDDAFKSMLREISNLPDHTPSPEDLKKKTAHTAVSDDLSTLILNTTLVVAEYQTYLNREPMISSLSPEEAKTNPLAIAKKATETFLTNIGSIQRDQNTSTEKEEAFYRFTVTFKSAVQTYQTSKLQQHPQPAAAPKAASVATTPGATFSKAAADAKEKADAMTSLLRRIDAIPTQKPSVAAAPQTPSKGATTRR